MGYLEQDKIYSFLHGKEIEDRIENYAIFAQFQETLVRYVRDFTMAIFQEIFFLRKEKY